MPPDGRHTSVGRRAVASMRHAFERLDRRLRGDSEPIEGQRLAPRALGPTLMTEDGTSPAHAQTLETDQSFYFGFIVVILGLISGLVTFLVLSGLTPLVPSAGIVTTVVYINAALILAMIVVIWRHLRGLIRQWRARVPGARLHGRIVVLFSIIAALPGLLLAIGATTTFSRTLDGIFNRETRLIIENSLDVANAYLQEHGRVINADIVNMAKDLDGAAPRALNDVNMLRTLLLAQAGLRRLTAAYVIEPDGKVFAASIDEERVPYITPARTIIATAAAGQEVPVLLQTSANRVAAVARLENYGGRVLYVA
ncbi:MAG: nitrogen regulatory signal transduction histidine kinase NtrY, partial [Pseudomonadota bacterium]